jgi:hypothetical protein
VFTPGTPFYAALEHPGSVMISSTTSPMGCRRRSPLALLFVTTVTQELEKRTHDIDLVDIASPPAAHGGCRRLCRDVGSKRQANGKTPD